MSATVFVFVGPATPALAYTYYPEGCQLKVNAPVYQYFGRDDRRVTAAGSWDCGNVKRTINLTSFTLDGSVPTGTYTHKFSNVTHGSWSYNADCSSNGIGTIVASQVFQTVKFDEVSGFGSASTTEYCRLWGT